MKNIVNTLISIALAIILILGLVWYIFGGKDQIKVLYDEFANGNAVEENNNQAMLPSDYQEELIDEPKEEKEEIPQITKIVFTGDVELSEYVQAKYDSNGLDGILSESLQQTLKESTFLMINNEFCFSERGEAADKQYTFRVNPSYVGILNDMKVDIAGLANNHVLDYGKDALEDTFQTLSSAGILYTGAGNDLDEAAQMIVMEDAKGRTYGFMASSHVIPTYDWDVKSSKPGEFTFYDETELVNRVEQYSKEVDYLFVMVHWGIERTIELEDYQVNDGHKLIDAGAAAVIGMHSHCLQPVEYYNGHPIFYSLGNFIFNTSIKDGAAVEITVNENDELSARIIPIVAADTKTVENYDLVEYVKSISDTVDIDEKGNIVSK